MRKLLVFVVLALTIAGCGAPRVVDGNETQVTVRSFEFPSSPPDVVAAEHCGQFQRRAKLIDTEPDSLARVRFVYDCKS